MGKHVRIALLLGLVAWAGCGRKRVPAEPPAWRAAVPRQEAAPLVYERDGSLKGSALRVAWLEIPAAFKRSAARSVGPHEVYEAANVPFDKVTDFLSRRVFSGRVDMSSGHAYYHTVMPLDMNANAARLNLLLTQIAGKITLDIERLPRAAEIVPLSDEQARKLISRDLERAQ